MYFFVPFGYNESMPRSDAMLSDHVTQTTRPPPEVVVQFH
jgi:hypothetical protein